MTRLVRTPEAATVPLAAVLVAAALFTGACGGSDDAEGTPAGVEEFCAAVQALDRTDGTTDPDVVLDALEEMRRTAPEEVRDAVVLTSDRLIAAEYPDRADPSAEQGTPEQLRAASARLGGFVDEHCDLDR